MSRIKSIWRTIKRICSIAYKKKLKNKYFIVVYGFCAGCYALFAFAFLFTSLDIFAWLMYGALIMVIVVGSIGIIWLIRDAIKQIKSEERDAL